MYIEKTLKKFNTDKSYTYFPGNTIIKYITDDNINNILIQIKRELEQSNLFDKFIFLPENSYHMTVLDLITFTNLDSNPSFSDFIFKHENSVESLDKKIFNLLATENFYLNIKMRPVKITAKQVRLAPNSEQDAEKLKAFRNRISTLLGLKLDENYKFHISLSYQLMNLTDGEKENIDAFLDSINTKYLPRLAKINVDVATLSVFNDMSEYRRISLGRKKLGKTHNYTSTKTNEKIIK